MAKRGASWWYRHTGIRIGRVRRVRRNITRGGTHFFRVLRWLFSLGSTSGRTVRKVNAQRKKRGGSIFLRAKKTDAGKTKKINRSSFKQTNTPVSRKETAQKPKTNPVITSLAEPTIGEDISGCKTLPVAEMSVSKLSIVKEDEKDVRCITDENKTFGVLWKENVDRFFSEYIDELREGKINVEAVNNLQISKGRITAEVKGDNVVAYKIIITVEPLTEMQIKRFYNGGEKQEDLFPTKKDFWTFCNCDISKKICKHMISTLYAVGDLMDKDNTIIYRLRGL